MQNDTGIYTMRPLFHSLRAASPRTSVVAASQEHLFAGTPNDYFWSEVSDATEPRQLKKTRAVCPRCLGHAISSLNLRFSYLNLTPLERDRNSKLQYPLWQCELFR